ncbi:hypothetical protein [Chryseobacterium sp. NFX27]|uniref:hypothetical protein n=1 Tax=Chryseobacterium sp. NFX27 TaxID=2819618 RepID=UPI003CF0F1BD
MVHETGHSYAMYAGNSFIKYLHDKKLFTNGYNSSVSTLGHAVIFDLENYLSAINKFSANQAIGLDNSFILNAVNNNNNITGNNTKDFNILRNFLLPVFNEMIIIILITTLLLFSCSEKPKQKYEQCDIFLKNFEINENNNLKINNNYNENKLKFSLYNISSDTVKFIPPKIVFGIIEDKTNSENDIVVKPYIPQISIKKVIFYIKDELNNIKLISIDSSIQRDEDWKVVSLPPKEKFVKELFLDCKISDAGTYKVYYLEDSRLKNKTTQKIKYPTDIILQIKK